MTAAAHHPRRRSRRSPAFLNAGAALRKSFTLDGALAGAGLRKHQRRPSSMRARDGRMRLKLEFLMALGGIAAFCVRNRPRLLDVRRQQSRRSPLEGPRVDACPASPPLTCSNKWRVDEAVRGHRRGRRRRCARRYLRRMIDTWGVVDGIIARLSAVGRRRGSGQRASPTSRTGVVHMLRRRSMVVGMAVPRLVLRGMPHPDASIQSTSVMATTSVDCRDPALATRYRWDVERRNGSFDSDKYSDQTGGQAHPPRRRKNGVTMNRSKLEVKNAFGLTRRRKTIDR